MGKRKKNQNQVIEMTENQDQPVMLTNDNPFSKKVNDVLSSVEHNSNNDVLKDSELVNVNIMM